MANLSMCFRMLLNLNMIKPASDKAIIMNGFRMLLNLNMIKQVIH